MWKYWLHHAQCLSHLPISVAFLWACVTASIKWQCWHNMSLISNYFVVNSLIINNSHATASTHSLFIDTVRFPCIHIILRWRVASHFMQPVRFIMASYNVHVPSTFCIGNIDVQTCLIHVHVRHMHLERQWATIMRPRI